jgi:hypothetical protein
MTTATAEGAPPAEAEPAAQEPGLGTSEEENAPASEDASRAGARSSEAPEERLSPQEQRAEQAITRTLRLQGRSTLGSTSNFGGPTSFGGHAAARDVINHYWTPGRDRRARVGRVDRADLAELRSVYVPGKRDGRLVELLRQRRLVILRGEESSGRRAAALHALAGLVDDRISCIETEKEGDPLGDCELSEGTGYVLELRPQARANGLSQAANDHLEERLASLRAFLVILVPATASWPDRAVARNVVDHSRPDGPAVFERHLSRLHRLDQDRVSELIGRADIAARLHAAAPGRLADLASDLVRADERGMSPDQVLADITAQRARRLLHGLDTGGIELPASERLYGRALLLALAVFDGLPCTSVEATAELLYLVLRGIEYPERPPGRRTFSVPRADWLREFDATVEYRTMPGGWTDVPAPCATMEDPRLAKAVLAEAWRQHEATRSAILPWLRDLGASPVPDIRVRAAQTVGWLAANDFDPVYQDVIGRWANSDRARQREAAAWALDAAECTNGPRLSLTKLVSEWAGSGGLNRRRTATLCYGTAVFQNQPEYALRLLRNLARGPVDDEVAQVSRSVVELFADGHRHEVVDELLRWLTNPDENLARAGAESVVQLGNPSTTDGPALLLFAHTTTVANHVSVAALWRAALTDRGCRHDAWPALRTWFLHTDQRPELLPTLESVINHIVRLAPGIRLRLRWYLHYWLTDPSNSSPTAGKIQLVDAEESADDRPA